MATDIKSLAYYASRAKKAGKSKEDLSNYANYHEALPSIVDLQASAILWQELYENDTLVPLDEIDLAQADFLDIVDQIYNNVPFDQVHLAVVVAPPPITHEPYFPKYLASIPKDNRTPMAVNASIERLDEVIGAKASSSPRGNGLIVGRVQSGKTRNYIGLMLKAVDEGWNVIIVLTSAITTLAKQTRNRIVGEFAKVAA